MKHVISRGLAQQPVISVIKSSPRYFGHLTRSLLHEGKLYQTVHQWPASWHVTLLGERVMTFYKRNIAFHRHHIDLLAAGAKCDDLVLSCELLRMERDAYQALKRLAR